MTEPTNPPPPERRRRQPVGRRADDHEHAEAAEVLESRRRGLREVFEHFLPVLAAAVIALLIICVVLSVGTLALLNRVQDQQSLLDSAQRRIETSVGVRGSAVAGSCERLQLVRDDVNRISYAIYAILTFPTPDGRSERPELLDRIVEDTLYLPPTDCRAAVERPASYRQPLPVPFSAVADCYHPRRNQRPDPGDPACRP